MNENDAAGPTRIDARGLACPHPVLLARAALRAQPPGARVELLATDPMASVDVAAFCLRAGHRLVRETVGDGVWRFLIERG
jgi:tRNA 2-thiouridine synthesizing protein A